MIIDFHTHCFEDVVAKKAIPKLASFSYTQPNYDGTLKGLKQIMKESDVDKSVVLPIATKPTQTEIINRWSRQIYEDSIIAFGTIHPEYENWKHEIAWLDNNKIKGVKFHPEYQDFFVDDQKMYKIYDEIISRGLILIFHAGGDVAFPIDKCHGRPSRFKNIVNRYQNVKDANIIVAHMGGFELWEESLEYLAGTNIYMDTSFALKLAKKETLYAIINKHGADKILFGSDGPWNHPKNEIDLIKKLNITEDEKKLILGENAKKILSV